MSGEQIKGVYYESKMIEAGTMATRRVSSEAQDLHYYAKTNGKGDIDLYFLKPNGTPTAIVAETLDKEAFDSRFHSCADHECDLKPKSKEDLVKANAEKSVSIGEKHLERKEYNAAAFEFGNAVKQDKENLKAHLGKGKAHMQLGEVDKAKESFKNLSELDSLYEEENKHLFNEYGIELRKGKMYDLAIENYAKAISIDSDDEALYFNIARAYYEDGQNDTAIEKLKKALSINPEFKEAELLCNAIANKAAK